MAYQVGSGAVIDRTRDDEWNALAAFPSLVPALPPDPPLQPGLPACPEIDCVRHLLSGHLLDAAERQAARIDVGADRVLIAWGVISEETYVAALAPWLGLAFEPLFNTPREQSPCPDSELAHAANTGMLPLNDRHGVSYVVAPRLVDSRRLVELATSDHDMARRLRITSAARLHSFVARHSAREIERRAIDDLRLLRPELSAGVSGPRRLKVAAYVAAALIAAVAFPDAAIVTIQIMLGFVFLAWTGLRLLGLLSERFVRRTPRTFADDGLPVYSILIALHREAAAVSGLVASLRALNYPALGSKLT